MYNAVAPNPVTNKKLAVLAVNLLLFPAKNISVVTYNLLAYTLPAIPAPPLTCNAPVVVDVAAVVLLTYRLPSSTLPNVPVMTPLVSVAS